MFGFLSFIDEELVEPFVSDLVFINSMSKGVAKGWRVEHWLLKHAVTLFVIN
jgi:hypothetical protein